MLNADRFRNILGETCKGLKRDEAVGQQIFPAHSHPTKTTRYQTCSREAAMAQMSCGCYRLEA